jgi:hypothetical protein
MMYWTDGKRGTDAVERLAAADLDTTQAELIEYGNAQTIMKSCVAAGTAEQVN